MTLVIGILLGYATVSFVVALLIGRVLRHGDRLAAGALTALEPSSSIETAHPPIEEKEAA